MPTFRLIAAALAVATPTLFAAACAHAQPQGLGPIAEAMFARADANNDGRITKNEAEAARGRLFERLDANGDGFVTAAETEAARQAARARFVRLMERRARQAPAGERFDALDRNRDGRVARDEFVSAENTPFDRLDNGRGLTREDLAAVINGAR